jgi:hypothetical protein
MKEESMRNTLLLAAAVAALISCGGDGAPAAPLAQCKGTPHAAVVYVGQPTFPELAGVQDACVYGTQAGTIAELDSVVDRALKESGKPRVYLIGAYTDLPLRWRAARPGIGETTSLWFPPDGSSAAGIVGSLPFIMINDTNDGATICSALATQLVAQHTPARCQLWDHGGFTADQRAAAIAQLHLELAR